jgi:hypothetical protein
MGYSGARGTLIYEKNLKAKISCQTPFNEIVPTWKNEDDFFAVGIYNTVVFTFRAQSNIYLLLVFASPVVEFSDEIQTKVLRVFFLLDIPSLVYSFALKFLFLQTHANSYVFSQINKTPYVFLHLWSCTLWRRKKEKPDGKSYLLPYGLRNPNNNLKSDSPQDYALKPQWNCMFMNSASEAFALIISPPPSKVIIGPFPLLCCLGVCSSYETNIQDGGKTVNVVSGSPPKLIVRAPVFKRLKSPGINFKESIPPAYIAWRTDTSNRVVVPAHQARNRFLGSL